MQNTFLAICVSIIIGVGACGSKKNITENKDKTTTQSTTQNTTPVHSVNENEPKPKNTTNSSTSKGGVVAPVGVYITNSALDAGFDATVLNSQDVEGIYLRMSWNTIEPEDDKYNWNFLDEQISQAIQHNKKVVLGIVSGRFTPEWVFKSGVSKLQFTEINSRGKGKRAFSVGIAAPWDAKYQSFILDMQTALRDHLKAKPGFYDAVTMIKFTGININTNELRLPAQDKVTNGKDVTTDAIVIWQNAGYKPSKVLAAFTKLMDGTIGIFPDKAISVPYIPDPQSFPAINEQGVECKPFEQNLTEEIINLIGKKYAKNAQVQWNAYRTGGKISKYIPMASSLNIPVGLQLAQVEFLTKQTAGDESLEVLIKNAIESKIYYIEAWPPTVSQCAGALKNAKPKLRLAAGID